MHKNTSNKRRILQSSEKYVNKCAAQLYDRYKI